MCVYREFTYLFIIGPQSTRGDFPIRYATHTQWLISCGWELWVAVGDYISKVGGSESEEGRAQVKSLCPSAICCLNPIVASLCVCPFHSFICINVADYSNITSRVFSLIYFQLLSKLPAVLAALVAV